MPMEIYGNLFDPSVREQNYNSYIPKNMAEESKEKETAFMQKLQKQVPYMKLETGWGLSMERDKRRGVLTVNPKLLEKMQKDPEAEKKYTQLMKDIERAEKTVDAYYNALGGCVERTSHTYIDENGKYYHFAYTRRDDRLNKMLREEAKENSEKLIEKTREKAAKKRKETEKALEEKRTESRDDAVPVHPADFETIMDDILREREGQGVKSQDGVGTNLDVQV